MPDVLQKVTVRSLNHLDHLVGVYVMGLEGELRVSGKLDHSIDKPSLLSSEPLKRFSLFYLWDDDNENECPDYSRCVEDAWQVGEKVAPRSHVDDQQWIEFTLNREGCFTYVEICKREIYAVAPEHQRLLGTTDSRTVWSKEASHRSDAIAICLAALKTVGVEVILELNDAT